MTIEKKYTPGEPFIEGISVSCEEPGCMSNSTQEPIFIVRSTFGKLSLCNKCLFVLRTKIRETLEGELNE